MSPSARDDQLLNDIQRSLSDTGYRLLEGVDVSVTSGHVRLTGDVPTFHFKQVATSAVLRTHGVQQLQNDLSVSAS